MFRHRSSSTATTLCSLVLLIRRELERRQIDPDPLFQAAGLDPARLADPEARYDFAAVTRLWDDALRVTSDPLLGLRVARAWHPTSMHALGYAWLASRSLAEGLERLIRYGRLLNSAFRLSLEESATTTCVSWGLEHGLEPSVAAVDAAAAVLSRMCRVGYGNTLRVVEVALTRPTPAREALYRRYFRAPVVFAAPRSHIVLDREQVHEPLPTGNARLAREHDRMVAECLEREDDGALTGRVKTMLAERLPSGAADQDAVAQSLHVSRRTLQRRLSAEGVTYKELLDEVRRELAMRYVAEHDMSIGEITFLLGFSEPSNFARAFKRWRGVSPGEFRTAS